MAIYFLHCSINIVNFDLCLANNKAGFKKTAPVSGDTVYLLVKRQDNKTYCGAKGVLLGRTNNKPWPDAQNYVVAFDINWEKCIEFQINQGMKAIDPYWSGLVQSPKNILNFNNKGNRFADWLEQQFSQNRHQIEIEEKDDNDYQKKVDEATPDTKPIVDEPKAKPPLRDNDNSVSWARDPLVAKNAINVAKYRCEIDSAHTTFKSKKSKENYAEAHHLIPMRYQDAFDKSLDVECNVISLCPNCHRLIHLAVDVEKRELITVLYSSRKDRLPLAGINIDINRLFEMYL